MTSIAPPDAEPTPRSEPAAALHTGTSDLRALSPRNLRQSGIYIAFVVIVALFAILTDGVLAQPRATSPTSSCSTPTSWCWRSAWSS